MDSGRHPGFCDLLLGWHVLGCQWPRRWVCGSLTLMKDNLERRQHQTNSWISRYSYSGTQDTTLSDTANGVLYGCFAIAGFFAGSIHVSSFFPLCFPALASPAAGGGYPQERSNLLTSNHRTSLAPD